MNGFTKLDAGIIHSTIWVQPHDVLRVWIALLALADMNGIARTAAPALAHMCLITIDRMREILTVLESPDEDSRSEVEEGRRIVKIAGGWRLVNYAAYRARRDPDADRARKREWDRENRPSGYARSKKNDADPEQSDNSPTGSTGPTQAEAEAEQRETVSGAHAREIAQVLVSAGFQCGVGDARVAEAVDAGVTPQHLSEVFDGYANNARFDSPEYCLRIAIDQARRARGVTCAR